MEKLDMGKFVGDANKDRDAIGLHLEQKIELLVDKDLRVWSEGGQYIADVVAIEAHANGDGASILASAAKTDEFSNNLPYILVGEVVSLGDVWDGNGDMPQDSYCYQLTQSCWICYRFMFVDSEEDKSLESVVKITGIELL